MLQHEVDELRIGPLRIAKAELVVGRALLAQHVAHRHAHPGDQALQRGAVGRGLEVLDHGRRFAGVADQREHVAGGAAGGVVIDRDVGHMRR